MKLFKKAKFLKIIFNIMPVTTMVALIPIIKNDYLLTAIDMGIIVLMLMIKKEKRDNQFL
ncbi:hypothetical protein KKH82_03930 [Patescibacteria group bacterium]|nr:hypothetical protein [Patescibacteria group bacterium]